MANTAPPPLPQEFPHIFTGIAFEVIPEVDYADLCYLSEIVKGKSDEKRYRSLVEALRKIQWAKQAGVQAITLETDIGLDVQEVGEDVLLYEPVGQVEHAKAMFDFVAHAKAALDSLAVFLTDYFHLAAHGGDRDFRRSAFREKVREADDAIGGHIASLQPWLAPGRQSLDSLIAVRDEWLHRLSSSIALILPRSEVGFLPIPRLGMSDAELVKTPVTCQDYWSTSQFVEFHFGRLVELFGLAVRRCVELELATLVEAPAHSEEGGSPISVVSVRTTSPMRLKLAVGRHTRMWFEGGPKPRS